METLVIKYMNICGQLRAYPHNDLANMFLAFMGRKGAKTFTSAQVDILRALATKLKFSLIINLDD